MKKNKDSWALSAGDSAKRPWGPSHLQPPACIPPLPSGRACSPPWPGWPVCARRRGRPGGIAPEEVDAAGPLRHWGGRAPPARSSVGEVAPTALSAAGRLRPPRHAPPLAGEAVPRHTRPPGRQRPRPAPPPGGRAPPARSSAGAAAGLARGQI